MAATSSPTSSDAELPSGSGWSVRPEGSIFSTATSVASSWPSSVAFRLVPSSNRTVIADAPSTTWEAVMMWPSSSIDEAGAGRRGLRRRVAERRHRPAGVGRGGGARRGDVHHAGRRARVQGLGVEAAGVRAARPGRRRAGRRSSSAGRRRRARPPPRARRRSRRRRAARSPPGARRAARARATVAASGTAAAAHDRPARPPCPRRPGAARHRPPRGGLRSGRLRPERRRGER